MQDEKLFEVRIHGLPPYVFFYEYQVIVAPRLISKPPIQIKEARA
jgi:hypothetical protein